MSDIQTVILAAGKGTRMQSAIPKPLIEVNGQPMLTHVLHALKKSTITTNPIIVVGGWTEAIQDYYGDDYRYAIQEEINGTGGAVKAALPYLDTSPDAPPVLILYADHPFITATSISNISTHVVQSIEVLTMYTVTVPDFEGWRQPFNSFGRILRGAAGEVTGIIEYKNATEEKRAILEVNPGIFAVQADWLETALDRIQKNDLTHEYYLTDIVTLAVADGHTIETISLPPHEALGLNSVADIENAKNMSRE